MRFKITISHGESDTFYGLYDSLDEDHAFIYHVYVSKVPDAYARLCLIRDGLNAIDEENNANA